MGMAWWKSNPSVRVGALVQASVVRLFAGILVENEIGNKFEKVVRVFFAGIPNLSPIAL